MHCWTTYKWGDIATLEYGKGLRDYQNLDGKYPVYGTNGKIGTTNTFLNPSSGVIIGRKGAYREVHYSDQPFYVIDTAFYLKSSCKYLNIKFAYYNLLTVDINAMDSGSAIPSTSREEFYDLNLMLPSLNEQIAIVEVLSSLDEKNDLLHRQNKTLEQLAETLFRRFFNTKSEKWRMKTFSTLIENTLGGEWGKENPEADFLLKVCCIRGTDIADLQTGLATRTPTRFVKENKFNNITPKNGDLIMEISGGTDDQATGRTIYINEQNRMLFPHPLVFSNFCRLIRPRKGEFSLFLYLYIKFLYDQGDFFNLENGSSGIKNLDYKALLYELEYLLPNQDEELLNFNNEVAIYFEKINKNKHQIHTLTKLRDILLPKLISGEVRVKMD
jgi:type I restriction enzyme S subunit